jgi:hypothetical protein
MENFAGRAEINSMPQRALGKPGKFTRGALLNSSNEVSCDKIDKINTTCAFCKEDLQAIDYSHCLDCKTYVHNKCVAGERCPLQIIGTELCDNGGTLISCPGCGGDKIIKAVDVPLPQHRPWISCLFDFGSRYTRLRIGLHETPEHTEGEPPLAAKWESLDSPLVTSFWINREPKESEEFKDVKVHNIEIDRSAQCQRFSHLKRLLYDSGYRNEVEHLGIKRPVHAVFKRVVSTSLTLAKNEQHRIAQFVNRAMANVSMMSGDLPAFECHISVATPAKVDGAQRDELLTAVSEAGTIFFEDEFQVKDIFPKIYDVREPEMALAGFEGSNLWTIPSVAAHPEKSPLEVIDDESPLEVIDDEPPPWMGNLDSGGSTSVCPFSVCPSIHLN